VPADLRNCVLAFDAIAPVRTHGYPYRLAIESGYW
jgi:hypothetical protein